VYNILSGRPGSNRRRPAWEAGILPLNYARAATANKTRQFLNIYAFMQQICNKN
jgi:hypothetical protein